MFRGPLQNAPNGSPQRVYCLGVPNAYLAMGFPCAAATLFDVLAIIFDVLAVLFGGSGIVLPVIRQCV